MQFKGYNDDGLPHDPVGGPRNGSGSPARNYAIGAACIVVAVLSFAFLTGSTAVFIGIAGAVTGAVFMLMGIQSSIYQQQAPLEQGNFGTQDPGADYDWDGNFRREFGDGQHR
ncbi:MULTISPECIES: hypothetical protein [Corynebacterium]|uniref:Uncharacterized protein n=1 Tax=Corynebacterium ihumii TaxID=1232427 RepID=A0ABY7UFF5_9CORY|nr:MULTISPECIES: hypothetical protein [Corynebacterium]WCZ35420.1 hypothetical protein CIHUM_10145 [Corynebacterium ihumii]